MLFCKHNTFKICLSTNDLTLQILYSIYLVYDIPQTDQLNFSVVWIYRQEFGYARPPWISVFISASSWVNNSGENGSLVYSILNNIKYSLLITDFSVHGTMTADMQYMRYIKTWSSLSWMFYIG